MRAAVLILALCALGGPAFAAAPETSLRPELRPMAEGDADPAEMQQIAALSRPETARPDTPELSPAVPLATALPRLRPSLRPDAIEEAAAAQLAFVAGLSTTLRPLKRPGTVEQKAMAKRQALARGAVCGDTDLQGEEIGTVPGEIAGCGVASAVRLRSVSGVALSQRAVMDCGTAKALKSWVDRGMKPAVGQTGGGVREIHVVAHYACRTRNNQRGARISEHGKGRAIDIAGFRMRDGSEITVLRGWTQQGQGAILRKMHARACGPFGTVLGPEANAFHRDHFHFDTARYRSGSYCR